MNDEKNIESREKEIFDETQEKQAKLAKKLLLGIFVGMGSIFTGLGIILITIIKEMAIVFLVMGLFMAMLGIILYFAIPTKYNYEKYKMRAKKYGVMNMFELNAKIAELEARIEELEKENENK